jgi:hypothetical protein
VVMTSRLESAFKMFQQPICNIHFVNSQGTEEFQKVLIFHLQPEHTVYSYFYTIMNRPSYLADPDNLSWGVRIINLKDTKHKQGKCLTMIVPYIR